MTGRPELCGLQGQKKKFGAVLSELLEQVYLIKSVFFFI